MARSSGGPNKSCSRSPSRSRSRLPPAKEKVKSNSGKRFALHSKSPSRKKRAASRSRSHRWSASRSGPPSRNRKAASRSRSRTRSPSSRRRSLSHGRSPLRRRSPSRRCRPSPLLRRPRLASPPRADARTIPPPAPSAPLETGKAEVVESKTRQSTGERTYRAEILMPQGEGFGPAGRVRTMCIRGPSRVDREKAEDDAQELTKAAQGGDFKQVKVVAGCMIHNGTRVP
mmetsp:Transcript_71999/g.185715  ORF Transcript_71999/g.185715 Transcript_71999/m.185715 type:complete len:229 (+) Transcript_71999:132-818(+)